MKIGSHSVQEIQIFLFKFTHQFDHFYIHVLIFEFLFSKFDLKCMKMGKFLNKDEKY